MRVPVPVVPAAEEGGVAAARIYARMLHAVRVIAKKEVHHLIIPR
jgi:hypothetical protein